MEKKFRLKHFHAHMHAKHKCKIVSRAVIAPFISSSKCSSCEKWRCNMLDKNSYTQLNEIE